VSQSALGFVGVPLAEVELDLVEVLEAVLEVGLVE
jgi:hypothetical protein